MRITDDEQWNTDFDWFCVDSDGRVGHFASAGFKRLPLSVAESAEDLRFVTEYFDQLSPSMDGHELDRLLAPDKRNERYLRSFVAMANRRLYSFDIESYLEPDCYYFRVAIPKTPLRLHELPDPVREALGRTMLKGQSLAQSSVIPYLTTLRM
jgi:hypothetical protein